MARKPRAAASGRQRAQPKGQRGKGAAAAACRPAKAVPPLAPPTNRAVRVYADGIYDLFHPGMTGRAAPVAELRVGCGGACTALTLCVAQGTCGSCSKLNNCAFSRRQHPCGVGDRLPARDNGLGVKPLGRAPRALGLERRRACPTHEGLHNGRARPARTPPARRPARLG